MDDKETQRAPCRERRPSAIPPTAVEEHLTGENPAVAVPAVPDHRDARTRQAARAGAMGRVREVVNFDGQRAILVVEPRAAKPGNFLADWVPALLIE